MALAALRLGTCLIVRPFRVPFVMMSTPFLTGLGEYFVGSMLGTIESIGSAG